jgi:hypothetical protein
VLDAFCGCGTTLVAARQLGRRFVGIDISPSSCNVMGQRLEQVCGMRQAPPSMGVDEIAGSWDAGRAGVTARNPAVAGSGSQENIGRKMRPETAALPDARPTGKKVGGTGAAGTGRIKDPAATAYYRFSNLPRSAEVLRQLPGFEFENWAVLQLGEVLKHHGRRIRAQVNRAKVGDFGLDGKIYLVTNASIKRSEGKGKLFSEAEDYVPVQVKNTDKVGRPEIDKFAHALRRDERSVGFFIGWEFSRDALAEVARVGKLEEAQVISPVPVQDLIAETFDTELLALAGR